MKILLIGEYNRSHKFLKEGLQELGHDAIVISSKDGYKQVDIDILIKDNFTNYFLKKIKNALYLLCKVDLASIDKYRQIKKLEKKISNYDIVQFINENSFLCTPKYERKIFDYIKNRNKNTFLLSCGTDYISVKYAYEKKFKYSILTPYFETDETRETFEYILKYITPKFQRLHEYIYQNVNGVLASDFDYDIPLQGHSKYLGLVPNPINIKSLNFKPKKLNQNEIIIFHGSSKANYYKKGNFLFDEALDIIEKKYPNVKTIRIQNLPYKEYIKAFDSCDILLDQVYAYDQGFNALEAMAKEKVVFTGAEKEFLDYYNVQEDEVCINALPNIGELVKKIEWLLSNPSKIEEIQKNARQFIIQYHDHINIAEMYLEKWTKTLLKT